MAPLPSLNRLLAIWVLVATIVIVGWTLPGSVPWRKARYVVKASWEGTGGDSSILMTYMATIVLFLALAVASSIGPKDWSGQERTLTRRFVGTTSPGRNLFCVLTLFITIAWVLTYYAEHTPSRFITRLSGKCQPGPDTDNPEEHCFPRKGKGHVGLDWDTTHLR
jgi:hypothetical protein